MRYRNKGSKRWVGYQLQVTETAGEDQATQFITDVEVNPAIVSDQTRLEAIQQRLIGQATPPAQHYVDQGYMSGHNLAASQRRGIALRGLMPPDNSQKPPGFRLADFAIDLEHQQATCPAGQQATVWSTTQPDHRNDVAYQVRLGRQCQQCPFFGSASCTTSPQGRHLRVTCYHDLIQARRREAQCLDFQREMHTRAAIEGTVSEMVRAHGARRARYRGLAKNALQAAFIATATNLKRLARCFAAQCSTTHRLLFGGSRHAVVKVLEFFNKVSDACGTPVVASEVGGLAYLIRDGKPGFHVPVREPGVLADRIMVVLENPALRDQMGQAALQAARAYAWPLIADRLLESFEALTETTPGVTPALTSV